MALLVRLRKSPKVLSPGRGNEEHIPFHRALLAVGDKLLIADVQQFGANADSSGNITVSIANAGGSDNPAIRGIEIVQLQ